MAQLSELCKENSNPLPVYNVGNATKTDVAKIKLFFSVQQFTFILVLIQFSIYHFYF